MNFDWFEPIKDQIWTWWDFAFVMGVIFGPPALFLAVGGLLEWRRHRHER
jgi:hypothetical protein